MAEPSVLPDRAGTHDPSGPALEVHDLTLETATGAEVVGGASFTVSPGEILSIVGESGSGKTAIALALLGHTRPGMRVTRGKVLVRGRDVLSCTARELQRLRGVGVAYVPQDAPTSLNPRMRIGTHLRESMTVHGISAAEADRRAAQLVRRVGLPDRVHRAYPFQLSGGQQQRLMIAMALAGRPAVVVLDEPTTGLDVTSQAKVLELIAELASDGLAFVYITHDLAVVEEISTHIAVMYAGRLVEQGEADALVGNPQHPYSRLLLDAVPRISVEHHGLGIPGLMPQPGHRPAGCHFADRCPLADERCRTTFPPAVTDGRSSVRCWKPGVLQIEKTPALPRDVTCRADALLTVEDLVIGYGGDPVVKGISFDVAAGECVALVGESGSGKSTTGRAIAGLLRPLSGRIQLAGEALGADVEHRSGEQRRQMQLIFQNPDRSLNPSQTVATILSRPLRMFDVATRHTVRVEAESLLQRVHLSKRALDKYPHELSGGEKQRVAIARALAARPSMLICDEVTSALDVSVQASIVRLLEELRHDGLAMLFITHNLGVVRSLADQVLVLKGGAVRESGATASVLTGPADAYTAELIAAAPELGKRSAG